MPIPSVVHVKNSLAYVVIVTESNRKYKEQLIKANKAHKLSFIYM